MIIAQFIESTYGLRRHTPLDFLRIWQACFNRKTCEKTWCTKSMNGPDEDIGNSLRLFHSSDRLGCFQTIMVVYSKLFERSAGANCSCCGVFTEASASQSFKL
jgi:hypothetical protein